MSGGETTRGARSQHGDSPPSSSLPAPGVLTVSAAHRAWGLSRENGWTLGAQQVGGWGSPGVRVQHIRCLSPFSSHPTPPTGSALSPTSLCWSPDPQEPQNETVFGNGVFKKVITVTQGREAGVLKRSGHRYTGRDEHVRTQGEDGGLHTSERPPTLGEKHCLFMPLVCGVLLQQPCKLTQAGTSTLCHGPSERAGHPHCQ